MSRISRSLRHSLNEKFVAPEKEFSERLPGGQKRYEQRVKEAERQYYEKMQNRFARELSESTSFMDLLRISREMCEYGYSFPVAGMVRNTEPMNANPSDIYWMTYDRESSLDTQTFLDMEKAPNRYGADTYIYTYYYSWDFWVVNILRHLYFWNQPFGNEADAGINEYMRKYAPLITKQKPRK